MRLWRTMRWRFQPIFSLSERCGVKLFPFSQFSLRSLRMGNWLSLRHPAIKAIGGGSRSKFWFHVFLIVNLMYFHPLFTELKNIDPLAQNWRICRGGWGPPGGHFGPFWEIWRLNADKNEKICTFLGFKSWIMVKEVCQMVKTENFVNHWPVGALQGRRDSIIPFYPQINNHIVNMAIPAWIHTLLKNKIGQNGSKMSIHTPESVTDHVECIHIDQ